MDYLQAAETLMDGNTIASVMAFLIAVMVLLILVAKAIDAAKKLFPKTNTDLFQQHCEDAEARFKRGEKHIAESQDRIADLREGQRSLCVAVMALLNHELHNGNSDEMHRASVGLNDYLINRK